MVDLDGLSGGCSRVLRVVTLASATGKYGGPTDTAIRQARLLDSPVRRVRVVAASFSGDEPNNPLLRTAPAQRLLGQRGYSTLFSLRVASLLVKSTRSADIVHISIAREAIPIAATLVAFVMRKPIVMQPHGMLTARTSPAHRLVDVFLRPMVRRSRVLIALTDVERHDLLAWFRGGRSPSIEVVGNPSPDLTRQPSPDPPIVFFAARLHPRKRVADFVSAARASHQRGENLRWVVAGPDQGDLAIVESALADTPNLAYVGALTPEEVDQLLATASVFVLPSRDEPWGNVVATAIKARIPVVVTRSSAIADEVDKLDAGHVVQDESPCEIADAVVSLLDFVPPSVDKHTSGIAERFGNSGIAAALERAYESAMGTRVTAGACKGGRR